MRKSEAEPSAGASSVLRSDLVIRIHSPSLRKLSALPFTHTLLLLGRLFKERKSVLSPYGGFVHRVGLLFDADRSWASVRRLWSIVCYWLRCGLFLQPAADISIGTGH